MRSLQVYRVNLDSREQRRQLMVLLAGGFLLVLAAAVLLVWADPYGSYPLPSCRVSVSRLPAPPRTAGMRTFSRAPLLSGRGSEYCFRWIGGTNLNIVSVSISTDK